ncbi:hypothetical protein K458DRAFT_326498 [Lentithecium fluviatile CBS 122367]|uniref:BZIP domain-containing protein n=1 Tax=Lentithecium fluviatile CBS 122367 TaxID=1168545 RepID=A0A6G1JKE3_9PLEO|nr:hypothetical protein K458DRAFT_326498 [Lentithecium fluviatile CBS 122367]
MKFTFKPFKGDEKSSKSPDQSLRPEQRRREQVRRAQRTHRERKEAYTKSLEAEVVQLRANESRILHETKTLYSEISVLKNLLVANGIPLPASGSGALPSAGNPSAGEVPEQTFDLSIREAKARNRQERIYSQRSAMPHQHTMSSSSELTESIASPRCLGEADHTAIGIDFVLTLEGPCLSHVDAIQNDDNPASTGHALMVTASMLHEHPADPGHRLHSNATWQVPVTGIERLLELSDTIPLDGELTPVQAWNHIRRHPHYNGLEFERLESLKQKLLGYIKCYGFGGVIDQGVFENAVFEAFVVGRVF